jgi:hypothetical protein
MLTHPLLRGCRPRGQHASGAWMRRKQREKTTILCSRVANRSHTPSLTCATQHTHDRPHTAPNGRSEPCVGSQHRGERDTHNLPAQTHNQHCSLESSTHARMSCESRSAVGQRWIVATEVGVAHLTTRLLCAGHQSPGPAEVQVPNHKVHCLLRPLTNDDLGSAQETS